MKMKKALYLIVSICLIGLLIYLIQPIKDFPTPPQTSVQSDEPGDNEEFLRRAYFVDLTREEVMHHYKQQVSYAPFLRFNYPPEEAQTIIRDQTRSSYLEEITQPFRLSVYVNGFIPTEAKDRILINGEEFDQKITIRYVPSSIVTRLIFFVFVSISSAALLEMVVVFYSELSSLLISYKKLWLKR